MEYKNEYTFFKNVALRMQIPLREMNKKEVMFLCGADCSGTQMEQDYDLKKLQLLFQNSNQEDIIYLENPVEDACCLYVTLPSNLQDKMIVLGPFRKNDFKAAHSLMTEFAEILWQTPCKTQTHSFHVKKRNPLIEEVIQLINDDITNEHTLSQISKTMHISPGHLSKLFAREMGMTLTEYVNRKKVAYGMYLINTTDDKISVIASLCGVKDNNYFSRLFKKYVGMSPIEYRKMR